MNKKKTEELLRILCLNALICLTGFSSSQAALSTSTQDSVKPKFGDYFNPGLSLGYGEGHGDNNRVSFPIPSIAFRMGRIHVKGIIATNYNDASIQFQYDLKRLKTLHPKIPVYLTLSGCIMKKAVPGQFNRKWRTWHVTTVYSYGAGLCTYFDKRRFRLSGNVSLTNIPIYENPRFHINGSTLYGQISFSQYLFKSSRTPTKSHPIN